jgi:hypothetical protein
MIGFRQQPGVCASLAIASVLVGAGLSVAQAAMHAQARPAEGGLCAILHEGPGPCDGGR